MQPSLRPLFFLTLAFSLTAHAADRECLISSDRSSLTISEVMEDGKPPTAVADGLDVDKLVEIMSVVTKVKQCTFAPKDCSLDKFFDSSENEERLTSGKDHAAETHGIYMTQISQGGSTPPTNSAFEAVHALRTMVEGGICNKHISKNCIVQAAPNILMIMPAVKVVRGNGVSMPVLQSDLAEFVDDLTKSGYCTFN